MLQNHIHHPELVNDSTLHVVGVISNPTRWHSRYRLAREWQERMRATPHVKLHLVEAAHGDRHHEVTTSDDLQLRTNSEAWIKENMINLGVRYLLPRGWKYMAWVDADVLFRDSNWAMETMHQLQHFAVVQPWQHCLDLGPDGDVLQVHKSFGFVHQSGERKQRHPGEPYAYAHTGYAWACTRGFYEAAQGLLDCCILGSADHHMAWSMIGEGLSTVPRAMSVGYRRRVAEWQARAFKAAKGEVGFVTGRIEHAFHGPKNRRFYRERWQILEDHHFDPDTDLTYDPQGLIHISNKHGLESALRKYNRSRAEDSTERT